MTHVLVLMLLGCHGAEAPPARQLAPPATAPLVSRRPEGSLRLAGELRPWQQVELRARLPAYVASRKVDVGDRVEAGDVLVTLAAPDRVAERAEAEAGATAAAARLRRLEQAATREGAVAALELEEAQGTADALRATAQALRELERELVVRAPFPGTITARGADVGALVGPGSGEPLVALAQLEVLRLVVAVPETHARVARSGETVRFVLDGEDEESAREAVVSRTSGLLDTSTRTLRVELDVDNAEGALLAGATVEVLWPLDAGIEATWVPATALVRSTEGTWVWVHRGERMARVDVEELLREGAEVAVRGAFEPADEVVQRGSEDYAEGPWPSR